MRFLNQINLNEKVRGYFDERFGKTIREIRFQSSIFLLQRMPKQFVIAMAVHDLFEPFVPGLSFRAAHFFAMFSIRNCLKAIVPAPGAAKCRIPAGAISVFVA